MRCMQRGDYDNGMVLRDGVPDTHSPKLTKVLSSHADDLIKCHSMLLVIHRG